MSSKDMRDEVLDEVIRVIDKYIEILERAAREINWYEDRAEGYKILRKHGLLRCEENEILTDPYYDSECIYYAADILHRIREEILKKTSISRKR